MHNRIVITKNNHQYLVLFIQNDITVKIKCFDDISEYYGQVYLGRVNVVKKNIGASFVKYNNKIGYLPNDTFKPESVFPIMVKKINSGNKEDELTNVISVTGLYCIISDSIKGVKFSNKLSGEFRDCFNISNFNNVIIRNNACNTDYSSILNEYRLLLDSYNRIKFISDKRTDNCVLYKGIPKIINTIFSENVSEYDEIISDDSDTINIINEFINSYKTNDITINLNVYEYKDKQVSLNTLISLSTILDKATSRKVYLKSDAYLIFDYTEAMNVIDVNSGTTRFKGSKPEVIHNINIEAAKEIAHQLKLRNLSGITIVDFINNKNKDYDKELLSILKNELKKDDCQAKCHGMTSLGLVEITRERKDKPLREQLWK